MNGCILALESDKNDIFQLQRAMQSAANKERLTVVRNRDEALCYLKGAGVYSNRVAYPMPQIMLVDVAAEGCGGEEVIALLKSTSDFSNIFIVATGRSIPAAVIGRLKDLGITAVFEKPGSPEEFFELVNSLEGRSAQAIQHPKP